MASNRPETTWHLPGSAGLAAPDRERIEDYLDHLCAPLVGVLPYRERSSLRLETAQHLEALVEVFEAEGMGRRDAVEAALREFGEPWQVGQSYLREWVQGKPYVQRTTLVRGATLCAFAWFGTATMLNLLAVDAYVLEYLPSGWGPALTALAVLSPLIAGLLTGMTASAQAVRGARNAVILLSVHSLLTGALLLPNMEGAAFAVFQLLFWLPAGCLLTHLSAAVRLYYRRRRFWRLAH